MHDSVATEHEHHCESTATWGKKVRFQPAATAPAVLFQGEHGKINMLQVHLRVL